MNLRANLKAVSLILGFVLWVYVNLVISPTLRRTVTCNVEYRNRPVLLRITPQESTVDLVLSGTRRDFIIAGKELAQASVDLYNLRPGRAFFPLKVTTPSGLSVVAMHPAQIEITGEALTRKEMEVEIEVKGQMADGYIADPPVITPRRVTLEGPAEALEKVSRCLVQLSLANVTNSISEKPSVMVLDSSDKHLEGIRVLPDKVTVDVTVKAGYPARSIPVVPQFIGRPPEGNKLEDAQAHPKFIQVSGPGRVLQDLTDIRTTPIDLSTMQSSTTVLVQVMPPLESLKVVGSSTVAVTVRFSPTPVTRTITGLPLVVKGNPDQQCVVSPGSYSLVLQGNIDDLNRIVVADLKQTLDTRSRGPGSYTVPLACPAGLPGRLNIVEILPPQVQITVSPIQTTIGSGSSTP